jgi:DNA-binding CsgD family transcriptional regulator
LEKLSESDFRKVLSAIEILERDLDWDSLPRRVVDAIATVIAVDFVSYNEVDLETGSRRFLLRPDPADFEPGSFEYAAFIRRFGSYPIVAERIAAAGRDNPELQKFINRLRFLGMVGNCCGQAEMRLNMGLTLANARTRRVGVALNRSLRDFDEGDAARLEALKPHIVSAYRSSLRRAEPSPAAERSGVDGRSLTKRESEVLYWVSMGKTNGEVGEIIGARPLTVKKHLEHIYDKLGVPNRTAAARMSAAMPGSGRPVTA